MTTQKTVYAPGGPQYVFGRLNLAYQGPDKAAHVDGDIGILAGEDFSPVLTPEEEACMRVRNGKFIDIEDAASFYKNLDFINESNNEMNKLVNVLDNTGSNEGLDSARAYIGAGYFLNSSVTQDMYDKFMQYHDLRVAAVEHLEEYDEKIAQVLQGDMDISELDFDEDDYLSKVDDCKLFYSRAKQLSDSLINRLDIVDRLLDVVRDEDMNYSKGMKPASELKSTAEAMRSTVKEDLDDVGFKPEWAKGSSGVLRNTEFYPGTTDTHLAQGRKMIYFKELSAISRIPLDDIVEDYYNRLGDRTDAESITDAISSMYYDVQPKGVDQWYFTDIETNNIGPLSGDIIEASVIKDGDMVVNSRFSPTEESMKAMSVGSSHIHKIYPGDVEGKPTFYDSDVCQQLSDVFNSGTKDDPVVFCAHHGGQFEDDWFRKNVPGYLTAQLEGRLQMVDSRVIAAHSVGLLNGSGLKGTKLKDFVEWSGGNYVNAHSADADTKMMESAIDAWVVHQSKKVQGHSAS